MKVSLLPLPVFNYMSEDTLFDKINAHVKYDLITDQDIYAIRNGKMLADCKLVWPDGVPYSRFNRPSYMTNMFEKPMPTVTATDTFEDLTNKRAVDLAKKYSNTDKNIFVYWSGGIDSTLIIAALYKNWDKNLLNRVTVILTADSIISNPNFYNKFIKDRFPTRFLGTFLGTQEGFCIHGDMADALWIQGNIVSLSAQGLPILEDDVNKDPSVFYTCIPNLPNDKVAQNVLDYALDDSIKAGIKLTTTSDVFWWLNFSFQYENMYVKHLREVVPYTQEHLTAYKLCQDFWFDTEDYQAWSIRAQYDGTKFDGSLVSYKMPAKRYIYEFDNNPYTMIHRSKMGSTYKTLTSGINSVFFDDGSKFDFNE